MSSSFLLVSFYLVNMYRKQSVAVLYKFIHTADYDVALLCFSVTFNTYTLYLKKGSTKLIAVTL